MASHQMRIQHPDITSTLFSEDKKTQTNEVHYFSLATKILHRGKMIHIK